jgi:hypothetical protein
MKHLNTRVGVTDLGACLLVCLPWAASPAAAAGPALVMKGGRLYDPARVEQALGITPTRREAL